MVGGCNTAGRPVQPGTQVHAQQLRLEQLQITTRDLASSDSDAELPNTVQFIRPSADKHVVATLLSHFQTHKLTVPVFLVTLRLHLVAQKVAQTAISRS